MKTAEARGKRRTPTEVAPYPGFPSPSPPPPQDKSGLAWPSQAPKWSKDFLLVCNSSLNKPASRCTRADTYLSQHAMDLPWFMSSMPLAITPTRSKSWLFWPISHF